MAQPLFPSTIGTQSRSVKLLTIKTVVRKRTVTRSWCLDKAVLVQKGRGSFQNNVHWGVGDYLLSAAFKCLGSPFKGLGSLRSSTHNHSLHWGGGNGHEVGGGLHHKSVP